MPTIAAKDKILVSGANGYLAMWVVRTLLERGYAVRGTVRSAAKASFINEYFAKLGYGDAYESVIVDDILKEGAFDEAVKGVDGIAHTASPFHLNVETADGFIKPAVQGTVGMLDSALRHGSKVKRIVVTSSSAAVALQTPESTPSVYSEADWEETSLKQLAELGDKTPAMPTGYVASKTLAEKAAWKFVEDHKSEISWDLSVINPPYIFGPPIHDFTTIESLNLSLQLFLGTILSPTPKTKEELLYSDSWADVRDVALGHVLAWKNRMLEESVSLLRQVSCTFNWQEWIDTANSLPTNPLKNMPLYKGDPGILIGKEIAYMHAFDNAKEKRILGIKPYTKVDTVKDTLEILAAKGW